MFLIEADCEYDVWGGYFGFRSVTGGLSKMTKFGKGAYLFSADQNTEIDNAKSQQCGFRDNLQSTITT
jgi:hypothetical protein